MAKRPQFSRLAIAAPTPPSLQRTAERLEQHCILLADELRRTLSIPKSQLQLNIEFAGEVAVIEMVGGSTKKIDIRNRGRGVQAVRICSMGNSVFAWVSLREKWHRAPSRGGRNYYEFESSNLTVFCGTEEESDKPQLLRAEWAGYADRGSGYSFQAQGAAHPHWQIDLFETLRRPEAVSFSMAPEPKDFASVGQLPNIRDRLKIANFEKVHFASAANWFAPPGERSRHQHAPADEAEICRWTIGTLEYLIQQLPLSSFP